MFVFISEMKQLTNIFFLPAVTRERDRESIVSCINETINHNGKEEWEEVGTWVTSGRGTHCRCDPVHSWGSVKRFHVAWKAAVGRRERNGFSFFCRTLTQLPRGTFADEGSTLSYTWRSRRRAQLCSLIFFFLLLLLLLLLPPSSFFFVPPSPPSNSPRFGSLLVLFFVST